MSTVYRFPGAPLTKWNMRSSSQAASSGGVLDLFRRPRYQWVDWHGRNPGSRAPDWACADGITSKLVGIPCRWQFMSDGSDIGFGIFLKTKMGERQRAGEMTEVLASQRYNAHLVPEDGTLTCSNPGICK